MKNITDIVNESGLDQEGKIKNQVCIDLGKNIGQKYIESIKSNEDGTTWQLQLKGTGVIDLFELADDIYKINKNSKYDCIKSMVLDYDKKTIIIE
jgi:hypothetical protein